MRHNTLVHPPIIHTKFNIEADAPVDTSTVDELESYYSDNTIKKLQEFVDSARRLRAASGMSEPDLLSYKATGYKNKILDRTSAERT